MVREDFFVFLRQADVLKFKERGLVETRIPYAGAEET